MSAGLADWLAVRANKSYQVTHDQGHSEVSRSYDVNCPDIIETEIDLKHLT